MAPKNQDMDQLQQLHVRLAVIFCCYGVLWVCRSIYRYYAMQCPRNYPIKRFNILMQVDFWEAAVLTIVFAISIGLSVGSPLVDESGRFTEPIAWHHTTNAVILFLAGAVRLAVVVFPKAMPKWLGNITCSISFFMVMILYTRHLDGRSLLDTTMHLYVMWLEIVIGLLFLLLAVTDQKDSNRNGDKNYKLLVEKEMESPAPTCDETSGARKVNMIEWLIGGLIMVMGTWSAQIGHSIFSTHRWDVNSHETTSFAATFFTWHICGVVIFNVLLYIPFSFYFRIKRSAKEKYPAIC